MRTLISACVGLAAASVVAAAAFIEVPLEEPLNWVVGPYLFPAEIIAGYNDPVGSSNWTESSWDAYILSACESYAACTSSITWQGTNSGSTGGRYWYGYVFRGGPTDESYYVRDEDEASNVTSSKAWTIVE